MITTRSTPVFIQYKKKPKSEYTSKLIKETLDRNSTIKKKTVGGFFSLDIDGKVREGSSITWSVWDQKK